LQYQEFGNNSQKQKEISKSVKFTLEKKKKKKVQKNPNVLVFKRQIFCQGNH
jgi:hypothetical protein